MPNKLVALGGGPRRAMPNQQAVAHANPNARFQRPAGTVPSFKTPAQAASVMKQGGPFARRFSASYGSDAERSTLKGQATPKRKRMLSYLGGGFRA